MGIVFSVACAPPVGLSRFSRGEKFWHEKDSDNTKTRTKPYLGVGVAEDDTLSAPLAMEYNTNKFISNLHHKLPPTRFRNTAIPPLFVDSFFRTCY